jgi:hypothetical protein
MKRFTIYLLLLIALPLIFWAASCEAPLTKQESNCIHPDSLELVVYYGAVKDSIITKVYHTIDRRGMVSTMETIKSLKFPSLYDSVKTLKSIIAQKNIKIDRLNLSLQDLKHEIEVRDEKLKQCEK